MEEERLSSFEELRAKFEKLDAPPLPGPATLPAGSSPKAHRGCAQSAQALANGKPRPCHPGGQAQPPGAQKPKLAHGSAIQKRFGPTGPPPAAAPWAVRPAGHGLQVSGQVEGSQPGARRPSEERRMPVPRPRHKLWTRDNVSPAPLLASRGGKACCVKGQKSLEFAGERPRKSLETAAAQTLPPQRPSMAQIESLAASEDSPWPRRGREGAERSSPQERRTGSPCQPIYECELTSPAPEHQDSGLRHLPKTKPLPSIQTLGPPPPKPAKPPALNLQAYYVKQSVAIAKTPKEVTVTEGHPPPDSAELEEPHNYEATIAYRRLSGSPINPCAPDEIADATYEVRMEELLKPWKSCLHQELSHGREASKETEPHERGPRKAAEDSRCQDPQVRLGVREETPGNIQMTGVRDRQSVTAGNWDTDTDISQNKVLPGNRKLARDSQDEGDYVQALEETPDPATLRSRPPSEEAYDDVECHGEDVPRWDLACSLTSDSEETSEEMYEDIYKTKSYSQKTDFNGKAALSRLRKFFKREKGRFKMKTTKSKENLSNGVSVSLPDLGRQPGELTVYDDVDLSARESQDEDKLNTWKAKFSMPKGEKEQKRADTSKSFSPRNFFKTRKQNLEKNRMEREEKLFRERFQYNREITVINRATVCPSDPRSLRNSDLPITPGEQLDIIDTTEQNQLICRNSKGKYGLVLIDHLQFS